MFPFIARRLALMTLMLLLLSIVTFLLFSAVPTDPAMLTCGKSCTPQIVAANRVRLGLDQPLVVQYAEWFKGIFLGRTYGYGQAAFDCPAPCLGYSFRQGENVTTLIASALPVTIYLAIGSFVIWMFGGITSGIFAALNRGKWQDRAILSATLIGYSLPTFFVGLVLLTFVVVRWNLLPYPSYVAPTTDILGFLQTMILPWISVAVLNMAYYTRMTRSQMLDTLGNDFIRTARAKGLPERKVVRKHAFRAGLTPIVTSAGLDFAGLLGGAVIIESVFGLPGIGRLAIDSVQQYDLPVLLGTTLLAAAIVIVAMAIVEILYVLIDPRVKING